jgi:hypothetical protein
MYKQPPLHAAGMVWMVQHQQDVLQVQVTFGRATHQAS